MTEQQKQSVLAVLTAALHNTKVVYDQLDSLVNPNDDSFEDFPMEKALKEVSEAVKSIEEAMEELNA